MSVTAPVSTNWKRSGEFRTTEINHIDHFLFIAAAGLFNLLFGPDSFGSILCA